MTLTMPGVTGRTRGRSAQSDIATPEYVSVDDLAAAFTDRRTTDFAASRRAFETEHGAVVEYYFATDSATGAVLVRRPDKMCPLGSNYQVLVTRTQPLPDAVAELISVVLHEKHRLTGRVQGRARDLIVHDAYSLVVYLLAAAGGGAARQDMTVSAETVRTVQQELEQLGRFARDAARRSALWLYCIGLAVGAAAGIGIILAAHHSTILNTLVNPTGTSGGAGTSPVAACLAAGSIGAVISVMVRITRGTTLDVDANRGAAVPLLAGGFRPVIGAVFGAVLLVMTRGGLLPFAPSPEAPTSTCFFVGLAFLAGFSERWAQDTIVSSAPKVPPARPAENGFDTDVL